MFNHLLYIIWNPNPDIQITDGFAIKWYGVMWGISLMLCFFLGNYIFKKSGRDVEKVTTIIMYVFIFGIIGSRLAHVFFYGWDFFKDHPIEILNLRAGGLASHGGVVGGLLGLYVFCQRNKDFGFFWTLDHGIIVIMVLAALVRFGNLLNSELYGKATDVPWAFIFERVDNIPRHPVVLYECFAYLVIEGIMLYLFKKFGDTKPGIYLVIFLLVVFTVRFLLEFWKEPDGGTFFNTISLTQALDLPFIAAGAVLCYFVARGKVHYKQLVNG